MGGAKTNVPNVGWLKLLACLMCLSAVLVNRFAYLFLKNVRWEKKKTLFRLAFRLIRFSKVFNQRKFLSSYCLPIIWSRCQSPILEVCFVVLRSFFRLACN